MDLHYSQTDTLNGTFVVSFTTLWIYTILKLAIVNVSGKPVSLPYGFTLFSNLRNFGVVPAAVSLPYGFTLFSNVLAPLMRP